MRVPALEHVRVQREPPALRQTVEELQEIRRQHVLHAFRHIVGWRCEEELGSILEADDTPGERLVYPHHGIPGAVYTLLPIRLPQAFQDLAQRHADILAYDVG